MKKDSRTKRAEPKGTRAESSSPVAVRRRMRKTQADLADRLGTLKGRVLEAIGIQPKGGTHTMAEKKTTKRNTKATSSAAKKSKSGAKKSTAAKARKAGGSRKRSTKSAVTAVERKAKQVLGQALKGAAAGAVRGAVEAVVPSAQGKKSKKKEESDQ